MGDVFLIMNPVIHVISKQNSNQELPKSGVFEIEETEDLLIIKIIE